MMNAWADKGSIMDGINWHKAAQVGSRLRPSPRYRTGLAAPAAVAAKKLISARKSSTADGDSPPPWWIRALLIGMCTGVMSNT